MRGDTGWVGYMHDGNESRTDMSVTELVSQFEMSSLKDDASAVVRNPFCLNKPCSNTRCERKRTAEWACELHACGSLLTSNPSTPASPGDNICWLKAEGIKSLAPK